ncbi:MAG: hypothetical protein ACYC0X_14205 [Pirellulaceae bacterium]
MAYNDGVKSAPIAYIGLVSVIVTIILMLLLQVMFLGEQDEMVAADQAIQGTPAALADLTSKQLTVLTRRELVDRDRGVVSIGISRAMELVVEELAAGKPPAEVAGPPLPAALPAAAPASGDSESPTTESPTTEEEDKDKADQPPRPANTPSSVDQPSAEPASALEK